MNRQAAVFRDEARVRPALHPIARLREEVDRAWIDDRETVFNRMCSGPWSSAPARLCRDQRGGGAGAQGVLRCAGPERLPGPQRRAVAQARRRLPWDRRPDGPTMGYSPVRTTRRSPRRGSIRWLPATGPFGTSTITLTSSSALMQKILRRPACGRPERAAGDGRPSRGRGAPCALRSTGLGSRLRRVHFADDPGNRRGVRIGEGERR